MKITIFYVRCHRTEIPNYTVPSPGYYAAMQRFRETYKTFRPTVPHKLTVIHTGGPDDGEMDCIADSYEHYYGDGWDCGAYQEMSHRTNCDFAVFFNSMVYFWRADWLERFVDAFKQYGRGFYAACASYEVNPHLRTATIACDPQTLREYPILADSRVACCQFEHGPNNVALWAERQGYAAKMVACDGVYDRPDWRKPDNIFRRGDQSNVLIRDRHTLIYETAGEVFRQQIGRGADGK